MSKTQAPRMPTSQAYHVLSAALDIYGKAPAELDAGQRAKVEARARSMRVLEDRVLTSAEGRKVYIPPSRVDASMQAVKARYTDETAFGDELARNGMHRDSLREALRRELAVEAVLDKVAARAAQVSELDAMLYYYFHLDRFEQPETRTIRHILVTVNEEFADNHRDTAYARITQIHKRLVDKPHRFAEQALKHSECPTALNGGLLGRLPRGQLFADLDARAFVMDEGEISEPVESALGFHLLYCERIYLEGPVPFIEAREQILERLCERQERICQRAWLAALVSGVEAQRR